MSHTKSTTGEAGAYGVGTRVEDTPEMAIEPTGAATNDEHSSSE
uniref:Putative gag/pol polyprotein n=1 Tax=Phaseolus vulgaris TaxID=3885 RepID=G8DCY1_PHAVU|nr:putative gag/pol polyprotein [Phaseolus vulgaris]